MNTLAEIVATLERTPHVMRELLRGLSPERLTANYGDGTWSAYEVLGHLIVGEREDWLPRIVRILDEGVTRPFDPFPHDATIGPASGRSAQDLLDEFASLRDAGLRALAELRLTPEHMDRRGVHPAFGEVTLGQLLATWAAHDLHHVRQACLALAWPLRDAVGPWRAYLNTFAR